jgi:hypothetical protein
MGNIKPGASSPNNLAEYRYYAKRPSREAERKLIRQARRYLCFRAAGIDPWHRDKRALDELHRHFSGWIAKLADVQAHKQAVRPVQKGGKVYANEEFDELVMVGHRALFECLADFDFSRHHRLSTFAHGRVVGQMKNEAAKLRWQGYTLSRDTAAYNKRRRKGGGYQPPVTKTGSSPRLGRWLDGNLDAKELYAAPAKLVGRKFKSLKRRKNFGRATLCVIPNLTATAVTTIGRQPWQLPARSRFTTRSIPNTRCRKRATR